MQVAYKEEEKLKRNLRERSSSSFASGDAPPTIDDELIKQSSEETPWWRRRNEDGLEYLDCCADKLRGERAYCFAEEMGSKSAALKSILKPDRSITEQICACFQNSGDFEFWAEETAKRNLARRARNETYGLYLSDARQQAADVTRRRRERDQASAEADAAEAELARFWNEVVPIDEAAKRLSAKRISTIPDAAIADFKDDGLAEISAKALSQCLAKWQPCEKCKGNGVFPLDPQLPFSSEYAWCDCRAASRLRISDPDYVTRTNAEIAEMVRSVNEKRVALPTQRERPPCDR